MSEAELLVSTKLPHIHQAIIRQDNPTLDWSDIVSDLEALNWLDEGNNRAEIISAVWSITQRNAAAALSGTQRFKILKLSRAKVFVTTVAHTISNDREEMKNMTTLCKKHITDFTFFILANQLLKESTDIAEDFTRIVEVYEEAKNQITTNLIHLDKSYTIDVNKSLGKHLDENFYVKVISPNRTQLNDTPSIATTLSKYNSYPTAARQTAYNTSFYPNYSSYPYSSYQRDSVYLGELAEGNRREGFGKCTYYNGDSYEGFWSDDRPHGQGVYTWKDGGRYEGEFLDGKMQGKGKRTFASGAVYEGDFENGKKHGVGRITFKNGDSYEGEWDYDDMSGSGVYTWHTGDKFTGKFRRDKREGPGVLTLESGEIIQGEWVDGKMKQSAL
mmetsp:Transcript_7603/g.14265  ORF Transcript_7603/g.14265 Transcript_7603/m.14265 type:complete len:387 (+) Transcript_7603:3064-4224(+)